jgi:hypothetical protein
MIVVLNRHLGGQLAHDGGTPEHFIGLHTFHLQAHQKGAILGVGGLSGHNVAHYGDHLIPAQVVTGHTLFDCGCNIHKTLLSCPCSVLALSFPLTGVAAAAQAGTAAPSCRKFFKS